MRFTDQFLDDIRDRVSISDVVGTRVTWDRKKTNVTRGDYWACCPFHGENNPSFHCENKKGRYHCFGCGSSGDHFRFLTDLDGMSFPRAVEVVAGMAGMSMPNSEETHEEKRTRLRREEQRKKRDAERAVEDRKEEERKAESVRYNWQSGLQLGGTLAEKYLNTRDIELSDFPQGTPWMPSLRFHPSLLLKGSRHPALIGGVQDVNRKLVALWRIFLNADGTAMLNEDGKKLKLGLGPAAGGAVRLGPVTETLKLTEGIETGLGVSLLSTTGASVWATLSTSGMINFVVPPGVKRIEIYADGDRYRKHKNTGNIVTPPGIAAANQLRDRLKGEGYDVVVRPSPEPDDWLDVWQSVKRDRITQRVLE